MNLSLNGIELMFLAHPPKWFRVNLVFEKYRVFLSLLFLVIFKLFFLFFLVKNVHHNFGWLKVLLLIDRVDPLKELFFSKTALTILDHIHSHLNFNWHPSFDLCLIKMIQKVIKPPYHRMIVYETCNKCGHSWFKVVMGTSGVVYEN